MFNSIVGSLLLLDVLSTLPIGFCIIAEEGRVGIWRFLLADFGVRFSLDILIRIAENVDKMISVNVFHLVLLPGGGKGF